MSINKMAGQPATHEILVNTPRLMSAYYTQHPDNAILEQSVSFGTSGHRGSSLKNSFNEDHVLAICQAICEYRLSQGISGPLFLGIDTHALSDAAFATSVEVFAANNVDIMIQSGLGYTPTPVISHAILTYNKSKTTHLADGVVITPSHNPPEDGGFKYNPPTGGPADTSITQIIQNRANKILADKLKDVRRISYEKALKKPTTHAFDFILPYVTDLKNIIDLKAIAESHLKIGVDPLGGASVAFWQPIAEMYGLDLEIVNPYVDPTFSFMTVDYDGKIRMDCSSPYAMASLIGLKNNFDIAFGNDPDSDRHGIVTPSAGLMNPNHYLSVAIWYLFQNRPDWQKNMGVGKTIVSSSMIDRVVSSLGLNLCEVPVGFKWFVDGLNNGSLGFGGEESAGASFLRKDGTVWTTDKDGIILDLLAAEITARTDRDPGLHYKAIEEKFGSSVYQRMDAAATSKEKTILGNLSPDMIEANQLAGEKIIAKLTQAPGNNAAFGGLKVITENGWFAVRPSGTEDTYKIYAESFKGLDHLKAIQDETQMIVNAAFKKAGK